MFFRDYAKFDKRRKTGVDGKSGQRSSGSRKGNGRYRAGGGAVPVRSSAYRQGGGRDIAGRNRRSWFKLRYWLVILLAGYILLAYHDTLVRGCVKVYSAARSGWDEIRDFFYIGSDNNAQRPIVVKFYPVRVKDVHNQVITTGRQEDR